MRHNEQASLASVAERKVQLLDKPVHVVEVKTYPRLIGLAPVPRQHAENKLRILLIPRIIQLRSFSNQKIGVAAAQFFADLVQIIVVLQNLRILLIIVPDFIIYIFDRDRVTLHVFGQLTVTQKLLAPVRPRQNIPDHKKRNRHQHHRQNNNCCKSYE